MKFNSSIISKIYFGDQPVIKAYTNGVEVWNGGEDILAEIEQYCSFSFIAADAVTGSNDLQVVKPDDRTGDFYFSRASTATYINESGVMVTQTSNVPRIDYTRGVAEFLIEYTATNYIPYSNDFTQTEWTNTNTTETANTVNSVDGTVNATTITQTTTTSQTHSLDLTLTTNSVDTNYNTYSIFVKAGANIDWIKLSLGSGAFGDSNSVWFNISTGEIGTTESGFHQQQIESFNNGWYRCSVSRRATANAALTATLTLCPSDGNTTMNGSTSNYIYVSHADYTNINHLSSHIPTTGTTQTRNTEYSYGGGKAGIFNDDEGVLFIEMSALSPDQEYYFGSARSISLNDGTSTNFLSAYYINASASADNLAASSRGNASTLSATPTYTSSYDTIMKIAVQYKTNDCKVYIDGTLRGTDTSFTPHPSGSYTDISFDRYWGDPFWGRVRQVKVFNQALTDIQLAALTSY